MAIRFDSNLNKLIRQKVGAYNRRLKHAESQNLKYLPSKQSIKDIKEQFKGQSAKRSELNRKLKELDSFNYKTASTLVELPSEEKTSVYNFQLAQKHQRRLKKSIDKEIAAQEKFVSEKPEYIMRRSRLSMLQNIKSSLQNGISSRSRISSIEAEYNRQFSSQRVDNFYDNFFDIMKQETDFIGYDKNKMAYIQEKLKSVSPETLINMRNNSPHIKTILDRFDSDENYNAQDVDALESVYDYLYENIDNIIEEYTEDYEVL